MSVGITIRPIDQDSEGVVIPRDMLEKLGLKLGDVVNLVEKDGRLELTRDDAALSDQLKAARFGMQKYRAALRELAK